MNIKITSETELVQIVDELIHQVKILDTKGSLAASFLKVMSDWVRANSLDFDPHMYAITLEKASVRLLGQDLEVKSLSYESYLHDQISRQYNEIERECALIVMRFIIKRYNLNVLKLSDIPGFITDRLAKRPIFGNDYDIIHKEQDGSETKVLSVRYADPAWIDNDPLAKRVIIDGYLLQEY